MGDLRFVRRVGGDCPLCLEWSPLTEEQLWRPLQAKMAAVFTMAPPDSQARALLSLLGAPRWRRGVQSPAKQAEWI